MSELLTKSEFASLCNVARGTLSGWIRDHKLTPPAIVGHGRAARINPDVARRQLRTRLDVGQRTGSANGARKRLQAEPSRPMTIVEIWPDTRPIETVTELWRVILRMLETTAHPDFDTGAMPRAYARHKGLVLELETSARELGFGLPEPIPAPDWPALAALAEEAVDINAWATYAHKHIWGHHDHS